MQVPAALLRLSHSTPQHQKNCASFILPILNYNLALLNTPHSVFSSLPAVERAAARPAPLPIQPSTAEGGNSSAVLIRWPISAM